MLSPLSGLLHLRGELRFGLFVLRLGETLLRFATLYRRSLGSRAPMENRLSYFQVPRVEMRMSTASGLFVWR